MKEKANLLKWLFIVLLVLSCPTIKGKIIPEEAETKYGGGTGEPNNPYQIATAEDLILLGETPEDYDKRFILTADIDLDPNLPGGKVFDMAVIAPDTNVFEMDFQGTPFTGIFDGDGHIISNLTIIGQDFLGLFGELGSGAKISNLGLEAVNVNGTGESIGGLVGYKFRANITTSYCTGSVTGNSRVGGLVGCNGGSITACYSTSTVTGENEIGGLVGFNNNDVGRASSRGTIYYCYSAGSVSGISSIGGLVGSGGGIVTSCLWDVEVSGQAGSIGGFGLTTAEMMDPNMFGLNGFANDPNWIMNPGLDYPRLAWEGTTGDIIPEPIVDWMVGQGIPDNPYRIDTANQLILLGKASMLWDKSFVLDADIDLDPNLPDGQIFRKAVINEFTGIFNGNDHIIYNLVITGDSYLGLFGELDSAAEVRDLGVVDVNIVGSGDHVGGLAGRNGGNIITCYATGMVSGNDYVGGLAGSNFYSKIANCSFTGTVIGNENTGGLVGVNFEIVTASSSTGTVSGNELVGGLVGSNGGKISSCYSTSEVNGNYYVGGFIGRNPWNDWGTITDCYSTGNVTGNNCVGGFAGWNSIGSIITRCYSTGLVIGNENVGGLIGCEDFNVVSSFWDIQTSGFNGSDGGVGLTTAEMMDPYMLGLNGLANDPNWILNPGLDYPRLAWEGTPGDIIPEPIIDWLEGNGTAEDPYRINTAEQLIFLGRAGALCDRCFILTAKIDLDPNLPEGQVFGQAVIPKFSGVFDGNNHIINNLSISGHSHLGLFGRLEYGSEVKNLGILDVNITSSGSDVGSLVGMNGSDVTACYSSGVIIGNSSVGGLVGYNRRNIIMSYSAGTVSGIRNVGGLVGFNSRIISKSYSTGTIIGDENVGGLAGSNCFGSISTSYSTGTVSGINNVGGLVGENDFEGTIINSYSTGSVNGNENVGGLVGTSHSSTATIITSLWDIETSGQTDSSGGVGLTTAEMMDPYMLGMNGFAKDPNWILNPGLDYPRLAWEVTPGEIINEPIIEWIEGQGTNQNLYRIHTANQLILLGKASILWDKSFVLVVDIDLNPNLSDGQVFGQAIIPKFAGVFDGNGHVINNLSISGDSYLGLFGRLENGALVKNLSIVDVNISGSGYCVGSLVGKNKGAVIECYSNGVIIGNNSIGGLAGYNIGSIIMSHSISKVIGNKYIGGLVGTNKSYYDGSTWTDGIITNCYSTSLVTGQTNVGGLVGLNQSGILAECYSTSVVSGDLSIGGLVGDNNSMNGITNCYSAGAVSGEDNVGGLVGYNSFRSVITSSYSTGTVSGNENVGGLVGKDYNGRITMSFWGVESSGLTNMCGISEDNCDDSFGKTTAEMQTESTFINAGWDFVDETANGTEDIWWIDEGQDYPRLWWELNDEASQF